MTALTSAAGKAAALILPESRKQATASCISARGAAAITPIPTLSATTPRPRRPACKSGFTTMSTLKTRPRAGEQAAHCASLVRDKEPDCRPAMEFVIDGLDNATVNRLALAFLQRAEELSGFAMCVYTNAYNAGNVYSGAITAYPASGSRNTMWSVPPTSAPGPPERMAVRRVRQRARRRRQRGPGHLYERHLPARNAARVVRRVRSRNGRTALVWIPAALIGCTLAAFCLVRRKRRPDPPFFDRGPRESGGP